MAAVQFQYSIKRGGRSPSVAVGAGSAISGGEALELNVDADKMTKADALQCIDELRRHILEGEWPPL